MLAAGVGRRLHAEKVLSVVRGRTLLARALDACGARPTIVVASPLVAPRVPAAPGRSVIVNEAPERGMTHSLRLADAAAPPDAPLAILLADTPFVDRAFVDRVVAAWTPETDVVSPERDGVPAHPAIFGPAVRRALPGLPDGDSLRRLRGDPRFRRKVFPVDEADVIVDVDSEEALRRAQEHADRNER